MLLRSDGAAVPFGQWGPYFWRGVGARCEWLLAAGGRCARALLQDAATHLCAVAVALSSPEVGKSAEKAILRPWAQ
eukprot:7694013-Pyramimonas_sp.AAC.1